MTRIDSTPDHGETAQHRLDAPVSAIRRHVSLNTHFGHSIAYGKGLDIMNKANFSTQTNRKDLLSTINPQSTNGLLDYKLGGVIGYGSSATVHSAIYIPQNVRVAIKMIDLDMFERNQIDELRRETALMALSKHQNVLPVYSSFVSGSKLCIVTPYLAGGSCLDIMKTAFPDGLDELSIATILKQALDGLGYLHKNGHIHRDVKAGNLLVDDDGCVLLSDFGVSSSLSERGVRRTFVGTPCWMAPEVMEQAGYDSKADIWSFGITAIELASGKAPFAKYPPLKVLLMTLSNDPPTLLREKTKHKYSKVFKDMIDLCLNKDPSNRPTVEKLLLHPFFKQARKNDYLVKNILVDLPTLERRPRKVIHRKQLSFTTVEEWDFTDDCDYQKEFDNDTDSSNNKDANTSNKPGNFTNASQNNISNNTKTLDEFVMNSLPATTQDHLVQKEQIVSSKQESRISFGGSVDIDGIYGNRTFSERISSHSPCDRKYSDYEGGMEDQNAISNNSLDRSSEQSSILQASRSNDTYPTYFLTKSASSDCTGERKSRFKVQYARDPTMVPLPSSHKSLLHPTTTAILSNGNTVSSNSSYSTATSEGSATKLTTTATRTRSSSSSSSSVASKYPPSNQQPYMHDDKDTGDQNVYDSKKVGRFELFSTPTNGLMFSDSPKSRRTSLDNQLSMPSLPNSPSISPILQKNDTNAVVSFSKPLRTDLRRQRAHSTDDHHHYRLSDPSMTTIPAAPPRSPISTTGSTSTFAHLQSHFEDLIKNNDAQQRVLYRILDSLQLPRPETMGPTQFDDDFTTPQNYATLFLIGSLEKQIRQIDNENNALKLENEQLRKELDLLRLA